ncbi:class C sortase [Bacillus sp. N9]
MNFVDPFALDRPNEQSTTSYYDALNVGSTIGSVIIPEIKVEIPIYHGTSDDVLSKGAGHLENSSLPSSKLGTHSVITAHRGLPSSKLFRDLDKLTIGDQFYVRVLDETLAYEVESINIVLPHETDWLIMEEDQNKMTLLTCDPYMINSHRMLVTGHQVPYVPNQIEAEKNNEDKPNYLMGAIQLLCWHLSFFISFALRKN